MIQCVANDTNTRSAIVGVANPQYIAIVADQEQNGNSTRCSYLISTTRPRDEEERGTSPLCPGRRTQELFATRPSRSALRGN